MEHGEKLIALHTLGLDEPAVSTGKRQLVPQAHEVKAALEICRAVADTIRELGSIPSGYLYAQLCGHMSLRSYEAIIRLLKDAGLVTESAHELTWAGPK